MINKIKNLINIKFSNFLLFERPGKQFMFRCVRREISKLVSSNSSSKKSPVAPVAIDAACQWAWHKEMLFPTDINYYGVDINYEHLIRAKEIKPNDNFIHANLLDLESIFNQSTVDLIVSTNTLEYLSFEQKVKALKVFSGLLCDNSTLIFNVPTKHDLSTLLGVVTKNFDEVETIYYKNKLTAFFETIMLDSRGYYDINLKFHSKINRYLFASMARIFYYGEFLTNTFPNATVGVLVICRRSRLHTQKSPSKNTLKSHKIRVDKNKILGYYSEGSIPLSTK